MYPKHHYPLAERILNISEALDECIGLMPFEKTRFGRLPGELRNMIYQFVIPTRTTFVIDYAGVCTGESTSALQTLQLTCRQLCQETIKIFYSSNTFCAEIRDFNTRKLRETLTHEQAGVRHGRYISDLRVHQTSTRDPDNLFCNGIQDRPCLDALAATLNVLRVCRDAITMQDHEEEPFIAPCGRLEYGRLRADRWLERGGYASRHSEKPGYRLLCSLCTGLPPGELAKARHVFGDEDEALAVLERTDDHVSYGEARDKIRCLAKQELEKSPLTCDMDATEHKLFKRLALDMSEDGQYVAVLVLAATVVETGLTVNLARNCLDNAGWGVENALCLFRARYQEIPEAAFQKDRFWSRLANPDKSGTTGLTLLLQDTTEVAEVVGLFYRALTLRAVRSTTGESFKDCKARLLHNEWDAECAIDEFYGYF